jgi:hypothetical protein
MRKTQLTAFIVFALLLAGCETRILGVDVGIRIPSPTPRPTIEATRAITPSPTHPLPTAEIPIVLPERFVCFENGINGQVWVRECPGVQCATLDTLSTGEKVEITGNRKDDATGTTWLQLTSPLDGWVSIRYICESEQP